MVSVTAAARLPSACQTGAEIPATRQSVAGGGIEAAFANRGEDFPVGSAATPGERRIEGAEHPSAGTAVERQHVTRADVVADRMR